MRTNANRCGARLATAIIAAILLVATGVTAHLGDSQARDEAADTYRQYEHNSQQQQEEQQQYQDLERGLEGNQLQTGGHGVHVYQYGSLSNGAHYANELAWHARGPAAQLMVGNRPTAPRVAPGSTIKGGRPMGAGKRPQPPGTRRIAGAPPSELDVVGVAAHGGGIANAAGRRNVTAPAGPANRRRPNGSPAKNLVCYYGTWAVYRPDGGKYPVENIDPFLCTHIIYGFTGLSYDNQIKPLDPWNDLEDNYGKGAMKRFTGLKRINPDLKTLVAIGGWNEGSIKYSKMASDPEARQKFVQSVVAFLKKYNFDGLDLDWEYPGSRGGASYDKQNFVRLLRELKQAFEPHQYLLTAAVSAGKWFVDPAYDIPQVSKYLDLINLMAYDYHGGWETKTGMNAPLFKSPRHDLSREDQQLNVNWSVNYWLQNGASPEKIMLGVGSYGRSFTLDKPSVNGLNAPASQKGQAGPYTREPGSLGYNEICEAFKREPSAWTIVRDPDYLAPYAYNGRQWVGYDDVQSLALKAQYAKSMGLGGMMMWSIETDDFAGRCHEGQKYPLLNTIKRVMNSSGGFVGPATTGTSLPGPAPGPNTARPPPRPTPGPTSSSRPPTAAPSRKPVITPTRPGGLEVEDESAGGATSSKRPPVGPQNPPTGAPVRPPAPSTRPPGPQPPRPTGGSGTGSSSEFTCHADGMFADPTNCRRFIRCVSSAGSPGGYMMYRFDCGPGTAFNEGQQYCDHIYNVPRCANQQTGSAIRQRGPVHEQQQYYQEQYQLQSHQPHESRILGQYPYAHALPQRVYYHHQYQFYT